MVALRGFARWILQPANLGGKPLHGCALDPILALRFAWCPGEGKPMIWLPGVYIRKRSGGAGLLTPTFRAGVFRIPGASSEGLILPMPDRPDRGFPYSGGEFSLIHNWGPRWALFRAFFLHKPVRCRDARQGAEP